MRWTPPRWIWPTRASKGCSEKALYQNLADDVELLDGAGYDFDMDAVRHGRLSPVFFGSALTNFGVEPFLQEFLRMTSPPLPRHSSGGEVDPFCPAFFRLCV